MRAIGAGHPSVLLLAWSCYDPIDMLITRTSNLGVDLAPKAFQTFNIKIISYL